MIGIEKQNNREPVRNICVVILVTIFVFCGIGYAQQEEMKEGRFYQIQLLSPKPNFKITEGRIVFEWEMVQQDSVRKIEYYDVMFWASSGGYFRNFRVAAQDSSIIQTLVFENCREIFKRHAWYNWRVRAVDQGEILRSESRSFQILVPELKTSKFLWLYPYSVQVRYVHRVQSEPYKAFLKNIYPNTHLRSYSDIGLVFKQESFPLKKMTFEELFSIQSNIGVGAQLTAQYDLYENKYIALQPECSGSVSWFSFGLAQYNSSAFHFAAGLKVAIMPKKYIVFDGHFIPASHIHYETNERELLTFEGYGWDFGIQIIIPQSIIPSFDFLGLNIETQRLPFRFSIKQIHDSYTGTDMKVRCFTLNYCFR